MALAWPVIRELMAIRTRLDECLDESRFAGAPSAAESAPSTPVADLFEDDENVVLVMEAPGVDPDGLAAVVQEGRLRVTGSVAPHPAAEGARFLRLERPDGGFAREFDLPTAVLPETLVCTVERGVVTVIVGKVGKGLS